MGKELSRDQKRRSRPEGASGVSPQNGGNEEFQGVVVEVLPGGCHVQYGSHRIWCVPRGVLKKSPVVKKMPVGWQARQRNIVAAGDRVRFLNTGGGQGVIEEVLPRTNKLSRPDPFDPSVEHVIAANVDQAVVVVSIDKPPFDREILDRYLVGAENLGLGAVVCLNKVDLLTDHHARRLDLDKVVTTYRNMGYPVVMASAVSGAGLEQMKDALKDRTSVLVGYSGVGKSSLLNAIEPGLELRTMAVSERTGLGRHSTVSVRLMPLSFGGHVVDTPGIREFGLWRVRPWEVARFFRDFHALASECRFPRCYHMQEPDCGIRKAVDDGRLDPVRYKNYLRIMETLSSGGSRERRKK